MKKSNKKKTIPRVFKSRGILNGKGAENRKIGEHRQDGNAAALGAKRSFAEESNLHTGRKTGTGCSHRAT
jgi:hypothetical protein